MHDTSNEHDSTEKNDQFEHAHEDDGPIGDEADGGYGVSTH